MTIRLAIATVLITATALVARSSNADVAGRWLGEEQLPMIIGSWQGTAAPAGDAATARWLGADGLVDRTYTTGSGQPVGLYVAYFASQRPGTTIHSPLHCLPGAGWELADSSVLEYPGGVGDRSGPVGTIRQLIAQKDGSRAVVLYWYAIHGRMIASELASRFYLLTDRMRMSRNDAALVRIVVPSAGDDRAAAGRGLTFIERLLPNLPRLWA